MTCSTPSCSRIVPCWSLTAFAQMSGIWKRSSTLVVRMLAWMSVPMPTTTRSNSCTDSWRRVSSLVESARTTCVSLPFRDWTIRSSPSMPSTSVPLAMSSSASAWPNRPSPMTATASASATRSRLDRAPNRLPLANDGPLLRELVQDVGAAQRQGGAEGDRAEPPDEHHRDEYQLPHGGQARRDARREADGGEGGDGLEEHLMGGEGADEQERDRAGDHHRDREHRDADRLPVN